MTRALQDDLKRTALSMMEGLATPRSLTVAILLRYQEWDQIAALAVDPSNYLDSEAFWRDTQATSFLRKFQGLPTDGDRAQKALDNFWASERDCYRTNERLSPYLDGWACPTADGVVGRLIRLTRKKIASVLGPFSDQRLSTLGRFGPGSTFGDRGRLTTIADKMSSSPTLTTSALPFLFPWSGTLWASACIATSNQPMFVRGNRFLTVPKDATKDRGIAVEPSINVFYQLALGQMVRERLRREGLDILTAQDIHRQVAREASIRGHLATIDLSNASDTVSRVLVKLLIPHTWFEAFDSLRSTHTLVKGKWVKLEKFSSMGNGYTFELETLIFWAISASVIEMEGGTPATWENLFVFGDDIIVPTENFRGVIAALRCLGFSPNVQKTFGEGSFRESCGGDFFDGMDVRPYFLKEDPNEPQLKLAMANGLRRVAFSNGHPMGRWHALVRSWWSILDTLPSSVRNCRGPTALGDVVIHDDESRWQTRERDCIRYIRALKIYPKTYVSWKYFKPEVVLATAVYGVGDGVLGLVPRNPVTGYVIGWVPYS